MTRATRLLRRRTFMKAMSLGISAPLALEMSRQALAQPPARPRRSMFFFVPHGMPAEHYDPGGQGKAFDLSANPKVGVLKVFKPYQDQFILLRGLEYTGRTQHASISVVLTGETAVSVDQVIGKGLGTRPLLLGAVAYLKGQFGPDSNMFRNTEWLAPELSPVKVADELLGMRPGTAPTTMPPMTGTTMGDSEFQKAALGVGMSEIEALSRELTSLTSSRNRLAVHLESLRTLRDRAPGGGGLGPGGGGVPAMGCGGMVSLPNVELVRRESLGGANAAYFTDKSKFKPLFLAQLEVARQALICGTRVVGLQAMWANAQINFGFMGVNKDHHDPISHSRDLPGREEFAKVQQWIYGQLEEQVLRPLKATPDPLDPGRNVLDNTLVYVCSEIADGNEHNCRKAIMEIGATKITTMLPTMIIGGGGGALATGQVVDFENRSHKDLLAALCAAMGVSGASFSGSPIKEILA